jgi:nucleoside-diphosphate-sugar epimerase
MRAEKRVELVTGATGFIGGHLARRLVREGRKVRVLCRKGSERRLPADVLRSAEIVRGDLRDRDSLMRASEGALRVYHCAGYGSGRGTSADFEATHVKGTRWLLEAAMVADVDRFVHLSSVAAFGTPVPRYFDDNSGYGPSRDAYSRAKAEGEKVVFDFHFKTGLPVTVLRPALVYGPGGSWFDEPIRMIEQDRMFLLGGARGTCHPCYVENLVDAMILAARHPRAVGRGYIVADGQSISFREFFDCLAEVAGRPPIRKTVPLPVARAMALALEASARLRRSDVRPLLTHSAISMVTTRSQTSTRRIREELGFEARYDFGRAVEELKGWYRERGPLSAQPR